MVINFHTVSITYGRSMLYLIVHSSEPRGSFGAGESHRQLGDLGPVWVARGDFATRA